MKVEKPVADYLRDILQELNDVHNFTVEGYDAFATDVKTQKAVIRCYEVIGEICKRLPSKLLADKSLVDWEKLIKFRDFLAHNYEVIGTRYIWKAVEDVPNLQAAFESLLVNLPDLPTEDDLHSD
jgi:uncharacterized protein with HEPN domain